MIALISPAKSLDFDSSLPEVTPTRPRFAIEAAALARSAARLPQQRLSALMGISPALAKLNHHRFAGFADAPERPALYAFDGDVYAGLGAASLEEPAVAFAQDHLRILSGLYGLLRPLDAIRPYRLEMGVRWAPRHAKLTDWWGGRVAAALSHDLAQEGSGVVLNLASQEYWSAVDGRLSTGVRVIAADFRDGPDRRFITYYGKRARGMMARWLVEHRISDPDDLRAFDTDGYRFDAAASTPDRWLFVR
jgi:cytoplasmic iron level regulating protein YaaA (DUF328/UPF0246 family)